MYDSTTIWNIHEGFVAVFITPCLLWFAGSELIPATGLELLIISEEIISTRFPLKKPVSYSTS